MTTTITQSFSEYTWYQNKTTKSPAIFHPRRAIYNIARRNQ